MVFVATSRQEEENTELFSTKNQWIHGHS